MDEESRYTDIAVVTSPKILIFESDDVQVEQIEELAPYIDGNIWILNNIDYSKKSFGLSGKFYIQPM